MTTVDDAPAAAPDTAIEPEADEPEPGEPRRGRRRLVWLGLGGAVIAAAGVGVWLWAADTSTDEAPATAGPAATATVERGTISFTESWDGTLGRGTPSTVKSNAGGTITRLADQDQSVGSGDELFRVDEQPVILLSGAVPMYRDLGPGGTGADVNQLETNLAALGYVGLTVDTTYTSATAEAVRAWQTDVGATATGTVARGAVVFAPGGGQVDTVRSEVGDVVAPGTPVLDITGTGQVVNLEVEIDDLDRLDVDAEATVLLPEGDETTGTVRATEVVQATPDPMAEGGGGDAAATEPVVQVEIALAGNAPDELVGAPVQVVVAAEERTDVLLVPVNALLALPEGGYGLEVVADDGTTSIVPVETGLFAEGKVEVRSADIAEGTVVGTAGR